MAVPDFQNMMLPLLKLAGDGEQHSLAEAVEHLAEEFQLSSEDRAEALRSGQTRLYNRIGWATTYLKKSGLLKAVGPGRFQLTDRGRDVLSGQPPKIDIAFLEDRFSEMSVFRNTRPKGETADEDPPATFNTELRTWNQRPGVEKRISDMMEILIPDDAIRRAALELLAVAIESADEEEGNSWFLREVEEGLRLMTGRLIACEVARSKMRVSVIGPISEDVRNDLGVETEKDEDFKRVPGGLLITFPIERAADAFDVLRAGLNAFIDMAVSRVRSPVSLEDHSPEAVVYVAHVVGRDLPQPEPIAETQLLEDTDAATDEDDGAASRNPRVRGRAPIFELGQRSIASLTSDIEREVIALPDLQRPFVWEDTKVTRSP